jgi:hypothetical protein
MLVSNQLREKVRGQVAEILGIDERLLRVRVAATKFTKGTPDRAPPATASYSFTSMGMRSVSKIGNVRFRCA